jgi:hypothetical protein
MNEGNALSVQSPQQPRIQGGVIWQPVWFVAHVSVVYIIVNSITPWLAGWTRQTLLPLLQVASTSSSHFEFLFSHLFAFSFIPGFVAGFNNLKFKHRVAEYVWVVPAAVLAYKLATFSVSTSVLSSNSSSAFHQYFGGDFFVPEYRNWQEFWNIVRSNPDMTRGMAQTQFTAPFYAGLGYCLSAWISLRTDAGQRISQMVTRWEEERFGGGTGDSSVESDRPV